MRKILFRGKRIDTSEWAEGDRLKLHGSSDCWIVENGVAYSVRPETVGQFTGFLDCDGRKIYEGDICVGARSTRGTPVEIYWDDDYAQFRAVTATNISNSMDYYICDRIIGNIYDTPELMEEE